MTTIDERGSKPSPAQEANTMVTDEMIEKAANAIAEKRGYAWPGTFDAEEIKIGRENMRAALEAALSAAEPVGYLVPRGDVAGPDNEYYSFCEDQGSAAAEADIYDKGYFPIYAAPTAPSVAVKALQMADETFRDLGWHDKYEATTAALAALSAQVRDVADSPAIKAIAAERRRQIEKEGWSPDHDDAHCDGSIALAAACYAMFAAVSDNARRSTQLPVSLTNDGQAVEGWAAFLSIWPWERHFWKPTTRVRDLEKAGALIAAELDRVIRAAAPAKQEG